MVSIREEASYKNYGKCLSISNGLIEMLITVDVGPRIIRCSHMGKENLMFEDIGRTLTHDVSSLYGEGKTVVLPVVTGEGEMELRVYHGADSLRRGAFDILEPVGERFTDYESIDLAVIPGMAFDDSGHRLGRGKGYYDRFLVNLPHCYKIGMCFDFQRVEHVPCESTDIAVDEVI